MNAKMRKRIMKAMSQPRSPSLKKSRRRSKKKKKNQRAQRNLSKWFFNKPIRSLLRKRT